MHEIEYLVVHMEPVIYLLYWLGGVQSENCTMLLSTALKLLVSYHCVDKICRGRNRPTGRKLVGTQCMNEVVLAESYSDYN